jgi:hypothetical protein
LETNRVQGLVRLADIVANFSGVADWLRTVPPQVDSPAFRTFSAAVARWHLAEALAAARAVAWHPGVESAQAIEWLGRWRSWLSGLARDAESFAAGGPHRAPGTYRGGPRDRFVSDPGRGVILVSEATRGQVWMAVAEALDQSAADVGELITDAERRATEARGGCES